MSERCFVAWAPGPVPVIEPLFLREQVAALPAGEVPDLGEEGFAVTMRGADGP